MFNKVQSSCESSQILPVSRFECYQKQADEVVSVPIRRELVDHRLKWSSVTALENQKNGYSAPSISLQPTIEDVHHALNTLRAIRENSQYEKELKAYADSLVSPSEPSQSVSEP